MTPRAWFGQNSRRAPRPLSGPYIRWRLARELRAPLRSQLIRTGNRSRASWLRVDTRRRAA